MRFRSGQYLLYQTRSAITDSSGAYALEFTAVPWMETTGPVAARAEVEADGYDRYWRSVPATGGRPEEHFRLVRLPRMSSDDALVLTVSPDNGDCLGWLYPPCGRARVVVSRAGWLTVIAEALDGARPAVQVCCVDGDERYGNPVRIPVIRAIEIDVEIGQSASTVGASSRVLLTTSFEPSE